MATHPLRPLSFAGLALVIVVALGDGAPVAAQFQQYTPGGRILTTTVPKWEMFEQAIEEARWSLGPLYLDPWIGIRNASYVSDISGRGSNVSDFTATAGLGLRGYVPFGERAVFSLHALPEYTAWADNSDRNRLNGRYGAGLFVFGSRLTLQLSGKLLEQQQFFSSQIQALTHQRREIAMAGLEVRLVGSLHLFGTASDSTFENLSSSEPGDAIFSTLDRNERVVRVGLRLRPLERVSIGLGVEDTETEFETGSVARDNSGTAPVFEVRYLGPYFNADLDLAWRNLEPVGESAFVPFDEITGTFELTLLPDATIRPILYSARNVVYTVGGASSYLVDEKVGLRLRFALGRLASLQVFGETGRNDYVPVVAGSLERQDDVSGYGADLAFRLGRWVGLSLGAEQRTYDSSIPGFDRDFTQVRIGFGVRFAGDGVGWPPD